MVRQAHPTEVLVGAEPLDAQYIFDPTDSVVGFFGVSSIERLPTKVAIRQQVERFDASTL